MTWTTALIDGYIGTVGDVGPTEELLELIRRHRAEFGEAATETLDELVTSMGDPGFEPSTDTASVRTPDGVLVGAALWLNREPWVMPWVSGWVDPEHFERGVGGALVDWAIARTEASIDRAPDLARVSVTIDANAVNERAQRLLRAKGFHETRYFLEMEIDLDGPIEVSPLADGITVRTFEPGEDLTALVEAVAAAFQDHFGYAESTLEERIARWENYRTSGFWDDGLVWLAEADGAVAGFNVCLTSHGALTDQGYVASLGVLRDWRGQGLARHLLTRSFSEYQRRGMGSVALDVDGDSPTGATRLYEGVGMHEASREILFEYEIRPGEDIVVR